jgi:beta-1,4-mannooligosaccharide/beta-1,4-mannosyl-N-acetylglucosamine phosphorylase
MSPQMMYECVGDVPNVAFPCAALVDGSTGRMAIYYGCADTVTGLAFGNIADVVDWVKQEAV